MLRCGAHQKELSGGFALTTNNRMELLAVIIGLEQIKWSNAEVHVVSDSSYVVKALNEGWLENWQHRVAFHWIKGHAGHPENERCDALAVAAYHQPNLPEDTGYNAENALL